MTTNRHSDPREQAEAVAKWMGWIYDPLRPFDMRWQATRGDLVDAAPAYWRSLDAMREVEDEIKNRGLWEAYTWKLIGVVFGGEVALGGALEWWKIATATPAQRLAAAARVIEEVSQHGKD